MTCGEDEAVSETAVSDTTVAAQAQRAAGEAIEKVGLSEKINSLPEGIHTHLIYC